MVRIPTKYETIVNARTAKTLGLEVPPTLLALANEVINEKALSCAMPPAEPRHAFTGAIRWRAARETRTSGLLNVRKLQDMLRDCTLRRHARGWLS